MYMCIRIHVRVNTKSVLLTKAFQLVPVITHHFQTYNYSIGNDVVIVVLVDFEGKSHLFIKPPLRNKALDTLIIWEST